MELNHRIHTRTTMKNCVVSLHFIIIDIGEDFKYNKINIEIQIFLKTPIFTSTKNSP